MADPNRNRLTDREDRPVVPKGSWGGEGSTGSLGLTDVNCMCRMDRQQGPTVQHRELHSVSCDKC